MRHCLRTRVRHNEALRDGFHLLGIDAPPIAQECTPGQFILVRGLSAEWPYLRRPFSVYSSDGESELEIVYKVVGRATSVMSRMRAGSEIEVLGPLGRGFDLAAGTSRVVGLAGGVGLPPVAFFCQRSAGGVGNTVLVVGAKTDHELLIPVGLVVEGVELRPYTEDGSKGAKGTVIDGFLESLGGPLGSEGMLVAACGPRALVKRIAEICLERRIDCQLSVEEMMACGVGACLTCAVPRAGGGYLHACTDGPVVNVRDVDWERWRES